MLTGLQNCLAVADVDEADEYYGALKRLRIFQVSSSGRDVILSSFRYPTPQHPRKCSQQVRIVSESSEESDNDLVQPKAHCPRTPLGFSL